MHSNRAKRAKRRRQKTLWLRELCEFGRSYGKDIARVWGLEKKQPCEDVRELPDLSHELP
jgi:hypothetical protein